MRSFDTKQGVTVVLAPPANVVDMLDQPLVWIDLEMTGLDHRTDVILEIAVIVTDGTLETVIEGPDLVIGATTEQLESMDPFVIDMHATSGLDELVKASSLTVGQAEEQVMSWLIGHVPEPRLAPLAGNSVHADRAFMFEHMPTLEQYVHYRNVDVSTIKELAKRWYPNYEGATKSNDNEHRAMSDIRASINELRQYRAALFLESHEGPRTA